MLVPEIQAELRRLQLHPVNLDVSTGEQGHVLLKGSLLAHWAVPRDVAADWFLAMLSQLPNLAGPTATMDAFCAAHAGRSPGI